MEIADGGEATELTTFSDVGAFAWYLRAVPWVLPGFSIAQEASNLRVAHDRIEEDGALTVRMPAFWLEARRHDASVPHGRATTT